MFSYFVIFYDWRNAFFAQKSNFSAIISKNRYSSMLENLIDSKKLLYHCQTVKIHFLITRISKIHQIADWYKYPRVFFVFHAFCHRRSIVLTWYVLVKKVELRLNKKEFNPYKPYLTIATCFWRIWCFINKLQFSKFYWISSVFQFLWTKDVIP